MLQINLRFDKSLYLGIDRVGTTCLLGHSSNPKCRWNTCRILNTRSGRWYRSDSASPRCHPRQYRNQLRHNSIHGPPVSGGPSSVDPRSLVGGRLCVRWHRSRRAARQHHLRPYKQCGSGVTRPDRCSDGTHCNGGNARGPADHERPGSGESGPGRWLQAATDGEQPRF